MGNIFAPVKRVRVLVRQRTPITAVLSGFTEDNNYALEFIVASDNPTIKDLLELINRYRSNPIANCETTEGRILQYNTPLRNVGGVVFASNP